MTKHVRSSYRRHRRVTWGLVTALVLVIAAIAIPIASGAPDKTYTLTFPATGAVTPAPGTSGNGPTAQKLCASSSYTSVKLVVTNTAKTVSAGSANVTFPANVTLSGTPTFVSGNASAATVARAGSVVELRELSLGKNASVTFSVALTTTANTTLGPLAVQALVKQSNQFNDTGGAANIFDNPAFPTIEVQTCPPVTISGRVFHDRDADSTFTTGTGAFDNSDLPKAWTVNVFAKNSGAPSFPSNPTFTAAGATATGLYSVTVPRGSDYKVCVVATNGDALKAWGFQIPTGNSQCGAISSSSGGTSAGYLLPNLTADALDRDFAAVPATPVFGPGSENEIPGYEVIAGSNGSKDPTRYTQEVWVDSAGGTNFRFAPITACAPPADCSKIHLIETMRADIALASTNGAQVNLKYDDVPFFNDDDLRSMPYCTKDPRPAAWPTNKLLDLTGGVLPAGSPAHTSCIIHATQTVIPDGKLHIEYVVYTSYDGGRRIG